MVSSNVVIHLIQYFVHQLSQRGKKEFVIPINFGTYVKMRHSEYTDGELCVTLNIYVNLT